MWLLMGLHEHDEKFLKNFFSFSGYGGSFFPYKNNIVSKEVIKNESQCNCNDGTGD